MIRLIPTQITVDAAAANGMPRRSISGIAVTYDETATVSDGTQVRIMQGALPVEGRNPKLYMQHQSDLIIGQVVERVDTPQGMMFIAKISNTSLGSDALEMVKDGTIDAVSVGLNPIDFEYNDEGVMIVKKASWTELSLVSQGAFEGAVIQKVAASIPQTEPAIDNNTTQDTQKENIMTTEIETPVVEAASSTVEKLWAKPAQEFAMPTPGDYMAAMHIGGDTFAKVNLAYRAAVKKTQTALQAAAGDTATTDTPGLLPNPVLGPLVQSLNYIRPVVTSFGARALPNGNGTSFIRPTIGTHTSAAEQTPQNSTVSATTMVIDANQVARKTFAGSALMSMQLIDMTDPAAMSLIINDLMGQYMLATDAEACTELRTASINSGTWDGVSPENLLVAIYTAAYDASVGTNFFVDTMYTSVKVWSLLGQLVDDQNRPVFPAIGAPGLLGMNTLGAGSAASWSGQNPMGLNIVVDSQFDAIDENTLIVANASRSFEVYENMRGVMTVDSPTKISREFSYYGYFATFAAITDLIRNIDVTNL